VFVAFVAAAAAIAVTGTLITHTADRLADRTGIGEALVGGVLLGGCTSLSGIVASVAAAAQNQPELAMSNALGGIAAQTFFLVIADMSYRRANLEHAAASLENLIQAGLLIAILSLIFLGATTPSYGVFGVHPVSFLIFAGYFFGVRLTRTSRLQPMWRPRRTGDTREDVPDEPPGGRRTLWILGGRFAGLAAVLAVAGYATAETGIAIADRTGISQTVVGAFLTAIATSIPELVTTVAAVRRGALTLAVGGVIGGNTFDTLFVASADVAYREGSIYHAISDYPLYLAAIGILMTSILLLGLLRRERHGIGSIGFESALVFAVYVGSVVLIVGTG
jgi:cation:H+ antiporter